jgi:hypothetical protein
MKDLHSLNSCKGVFWERHKTPMSVFIAKCGTSVQSVSRFRIEHGAASAVAEFNVGYRASIEIIKSLGFTPGSSSSYIRHQKDQQRLRDSIRKASKEHKRRSQKRKLAKTTAEQLLAQQHGVLYVPGGDD